MRSVWGCCLLAMTALAGCVDGDARVADDPELGAITTGSSPAGVHPDDGVAITYRHRSDTFLYARRGPDTALKTDHEATIDLTVEDRIACEREDDGWQCLSFGEDSAFDALHASGKTFQNLLALLPLAEDLAEERTVAGRAARCGEIRPSDDLIYAISLFAGTDVNRGADEIAPTSLCVDQGSGLLLSLRTPVPGDDGAVEITAIEARPATDDDFSPPAVVHPAPDLEIEDFEFDEECCDGS